jgi:acyl-CoA hydrolase
MEVGVRVETENLLTGEVHHTSSAYVVMVALDEGGHPLPIPAVIPETAEEERRMAAAKIRRAQRKVLQAELERSEARLERRTPVASDLVQVEPE